MSGVVCTDLQAPPPAKAIAIPAALTLSGISVTSTTSYSPNANHALLILPPNFSTAGLTASIRSCGLANRACQPSREYATLCRYCGILPPLDRLSGESSQSTAVGVKKLE